MERVGHVIVDRPNTGWRDLFRSYHVYVDEQLRGTVRRGKAIRIALPAGPHQIQARIDWTGSPMVEFDLAAGSEVIFRVEPAGSPLDTHQAWTDDAYLRLMRASEYRPTKVV